MSKINTKEYFEQRGFGEPKPKCFDREQIRLFWQLVGFIFLVLVVIKTLDELKIKDIIFGR